MTWPSLPLGPGTPPFGLPPEITPAQIDLATLLAILAALAVGDLITPVLLGSAFLIRSFRRPPV
jgi:hypothetical protein